jgi:hypothetical protein
MLVFKNIQTALQYESEYFVISDNEVHAFDDLNAASEDVKHAHRLDIDVELLDRDTAEKKYS